MVGSSVMRTRETCSLLPAQLPPLLPLPLSESCDQFKLHVHACMNMYTHTHRKKKPIGGVALFPGGGDLFGRSSESDKPVEPASLEEEPPVVQPKPAKKRTGSSTGGLFDEGGEPEEDDIFSFTPSGKKK